MALFITDLFHPVGGFAVEFFYNGDVGHGCGWRSAVLMLLIRFKPDDVHFLKPSPDVGCTDESTERSHELAQMGK